MTVSGAFAASALPLLIMAIVCGIASAESRSMRTETLASRAGWTLASLACLLFLGGIWTEVLL